MDRLAKRLNICANVAIIFIAVGVGVILALRAVRPAGADGLSGIKDISVGTKVSLAKVDWRANGNTLLFVLAKGCHYCSESAPFYQRILAAVSRRNDLKPVAVFPDDEREGRAYLGSLGLPIQEVHKVLLEQIGIRGTPSLTNPGQQLGHCNGCVDR